MVAFKCQSVEDKSTVQLLYIYSCMYSVLCCYFGRGKTPHGENPRAEPWNESGGPRGGSTKLIGAELKTTWPLVYMDSLIPLLFFR
jgi:hypothetical protein